MMTMSAEERHNTVQKNRFRLCQLQNAVWSCETDLGRVPQLGCHISNLNSNTCHGNEHRLSTHMHEDDSQKPLLLSETSGADLNNSDFKHIPIKEEGYELSVEPF